ncbi:MAG TPA: amidohydrolase family protein [Streptosporangiaceae bacterium]|jgi:aminocarboxymuconate-semialdehyde decarboxylase
MESALPGSAGIIDLHAHYLAPAVVAEIQAGAFRPHLSTAGLPGPARFQFPTTLSRPVFAAMTDISDRVSGLDRRGIGIQVLSTWIDMFGYDLPREVAVRYHTRVNEGLAAAVASCPARLAFLASVPLPWGEEAAAVLADAVTRLGAAGAMIGTNIGGANLDDPRFGPLWAACEQLGCPVELHPVSVAGASRLGSYQLDNFLGNPFDTTIAAASLIFGGVLDRHPGLTVILVHGGGYLPFAAGRMTHGRRARRVAPRLRHDPADYLSRFYYDTIVYHPRVLATVAELAGRDRIVLGSDYPFDMEPADLLATASAALGPDAPRLLAANARRLLRRA